MRKRIQEEKRRRMRETKRGTTTRRRPASDAYERANTLWASGKHAAAFKSFLQAATGGDSRAYVYLANFYDQGVGTHRDEDAALSWYLRAFRATADPLAANNIACILRDRKDFGRASWWFQRAVALGDGDAHLSLARLYMSRDRHPRAAKRHLAAAIRSNASTEGTKEIAAKLLKEMSRGGETR